MRTLEPGAVVYVQATVTEHDGPLALIEVVDNGRVRTYADPARLISVLPAERIAAAIETAIEQMEAVWDALPDDERPGSLSRQWWVDGMEDAAEIARRGGSDSNATTEEDQ